MKKILFLILALFFMLPSLCFSQNFWHRLTDLGNMDIYPLGVNDNIILGEKWGAKQLYRNKQPNIYWNIRGPGVTIWDIEYFANGHIILGTEDGAYISTDKGISWSQIGLSGTDIYDIYIAGGVAYCACWYSVYSFTEANSVWKDYNFNWTDNPASIIFSGNTVYIGSDENAIFKYNGDEWSVNAGVTNYSYTSIDELLEIPGKQYALTSEGLYVSLGNWKDWTPESGLQHWGSVRSIVKDPLNNLYVYDGFDVLKKAPGGTWTTMTSEGMYTTDINDLAYDLVISELYASGEGIYKYNKVEDVWDFLGLSPLSCLSSDVSDNNDVYFGSSGAGIIKIENDTAKIKNNGLLFGVVSAVLTGTGDVVYAGTEGGGLYKSPNGGDNWVQTDTILPGNKIRALAFDQNHELYAGTYGNGVFKSQGSDDSWIQINNGLTNTFVSALAYDNNHNVLFAGTHSNGVFFTTNNGITWNASALNNYEIRDLAVTSDGSVIVAALNGLFRINNNGNTWNNFETIIDDTAFRAININTSGVQFAGTDLFGAFLSYDNGNTWVEKNLGLEMNNLPVRYITTFTFDHDGYAYAGTVGGGVFKSTDSITSINEHELTLKKLQLDQNFPNPFFKSTVIAYTIPELANDAYCELNIVNNLGLKVAVLVNEKQAPGNYKVEFDASALPSGVYYCSLKVGLLRQTKKMLLLK